MDDDIISKQAAIDVIASMEAVGHFPYATIGRLDALLALNKLPSAERHGRWKSVQYGCVCSVCGKRKEQFSDNFCANCGAKMDGDVE